MKKRRTIKKYAGYSGGGSTDQGSPYAGHLDLQRSLRNKYASDQESAASETDTNTEAPDRDASANNKKTTPQQGRYGKTGNQTRGAIYVADDEDAKKRLEAVATALPVGRAIGAVGQVGPAVAKPVRTYAERQRFLKQAEKDYADTRHALRDKSPLPEHSNIYGRRGFTGKEAQEVLVRRLQDKGYKKGGSVGSASRRADGIAQRGKTKGRMV